MRLSERIKMKITPDFRFQIMICNDGYRDHWGVQLSRGMFHMCQFQTTNIEDNNFVSYADRTFIADPLVTHEVSHIYRFGNTHSNDQGHWNDVDTLNTTAFNWGNIDGVQSVQAGTITVNGAAVNLFNYPHNYEVIAGTYVQTPQVRNWTVHTAHMSCADYNRCREIVFTSDVAVKSEGNTSGAYKRFLCDYQITDATRFSYNLKDQRLVDPYSLEGNHFMSREATITETLPSHRIYQSANASAGRWQDLTLPSPLYEIEVRARVRVWDYETSTYKIEDIPLPAGTQYSVKLIFVSKKNYFDAQVSQTDRYHK
jgi:hypothetical protein